MPMTLRERLLTTLRGGQPDRIPWNIYAWLLPNTPEGRMLHQYGLGLMGSARIFRTRHEGVTIREDRKQVAGQPQIRVTIETPAGTLTEESVIEPGYGSRWIRKYFITSAEDYPAAEFFFRHSHFEPEFARWRDAERAIGDGGIAIGEIMPVPIAYIMVSWMGAQGLAEGIYDHPDRFDVLMDILGQHYLRQVQIAAESPAEVIWFPDNVTGSIVSPRLFERYCAPLYAQAMPIMRQAAKIPIAHYDGSNRPLVDSLARTDLPVIEAFTPPPMGDLSVSEAKAAWPDKIVWINFPGHLFLQPASVIQDYALDLLRASATGGRIVMGCTEDFPVSDFEKTFTAIGQALAEYEGYPWP